MAAGRLRAAGIVLEPLLERAGLSTDQIDCKDMRIAVASQIAFLELAAKALQQPLLGFSLACECDLREMGLLHYAAGATAPLGEAIQRFERYSSIVNEGIILTSTASGSLTIDLGYAGVARHSDKQQDNGSHPWLSVPDRLRAETDCRQDDSSILEAAHGA